MNIPMRDLAIPCDQFDWRPLMAEWDWLVPIDHTPLLIGAFGDWIIGAPDGSHWALCLLEGDYRQVASNSSEFNQNKLLPKNLDEWFKADWVGLAARQGLIPGGHECLGWKFHPKIGGPFSVENIGVFSLRVYQSLMGQLHRHIIERGQPSGFTVS
jgi:hypothetical protein